MTIPMPRLDEAVRALAELEPLLSHEVYRVALSDQIGGWRITVDAPLSADAVRMARRLGTAEAPALRRRDAVEQVTNYVGRRGRVRVDVVLHERLVVRVGGKR